MILTFFILNNLNLVFFFKEKESLFTFPLKYGLLIKAYLKGS